MTSPTRRRPPLDADERGQLTGWLQLQRAIIHMKADGLDPADAHRVVVPTSPLMTVAGIVSHLRWVEHTWFQVLFLGGDESDNPSFDKEVEDREMRVDGVALPRLLTEYNAQCEASDEVIHGHDLGSTGRHSGYAAGGASLRWMLVHVIEETARHAGHLDIIRELLDGRKGYY